MNIRSIKAKLNVISVSIMLSLVWAPAIAQAAATSSTAGDSTGSNSATTKQNSASSTGQAQKLANIINRGNQEIGRRLANLSKLSSLLTASSKLTASDQAALSSEVSTTTSGLKTLKTQLDSETTVSAAVTDVQNIFSEYRVYALVDPKIHLIKVADDQQAIETNLSGLSSKLQTRISTDSSNGQSVTTLNTELASMNSSTQAAQTISASVEAAVINLQPTDYNSNHSLLAGFNTQLATARSDIKSAYSEAKTLVSALKATTSTSSQTTTK